MENEKQTTQNSTSLCGKTDLQQQYRGRQLATGNTELWKSLRRCSIWVCLLSPTFHLTYAHN